jgi:chromosome segregation ATPase
MRNGRCAGHGGKTPSGSAWHRIQPASSIAKADRKAADVARRRAKLAARIAGMNDEERERYNRRSQAARPGTPAERQQRRRDRALREESARLSGQPAPVSPEIADLDRQIAELEAQIAERLKDGANE